MSKSGMCSFRPFRPASLTDTPSLTDMANLPSDAPVGVPVDNDYAKTTSTTDASGPIPVSKDSDAVETGVNPATEDSDEQLAKDDADAIDSSNIIDSKTRGAKPTGSYSEGPDEDVC